MRPRWSLLSRWLPQRLGSQLHLLAALSLSTAIILFGIHAAREQSGLALAAMEQQATAIARDLALLSEPLMVADKLDDLEVLLGNAMQLEPILAVRVIDARGLSVGHLEREPGQKPRVIYSQTDERQPVPDAPRAQWLLDDEAQRVIAWQPIVSGTLLGWVRVDHGTQALAGLRQRIWATTLLACLLASLASIGLMHALMRRPLRALDEAQRFAAGLQRIDGQQLSGIEGPREMRDLALALNQASTRLFKQRGTIEASLRQLQQHEAALALSNEQLRTIFALSPDAFLSIDNQGRASFANDAFYALTGLTADAVIGLPWQRVDDALCSQAQTAGTPPPLARLMAQRKAEPQQLMLARPRLRVLHLLARAGETASVSWLIYIRDVTREFEIDNMKTEFLSTAAHELRTPMTGIFSCVELMLARELSPTRQRDLLGIVHRQSRVMMNIVNELLDISRLEARGSSDFCFETLPLGSAIGPAIDDFVAPEGRQRPQCSGFDDRWAVHVDLGKLGQVVGNLLSNAYKYSRDGPVRLRGLPPRESARGTQVGFAVEDHGIGMTAEQLARVTERFYRADASGHVLGTGLGMSIVDNIVSLLGGELELSSEPGQGTTVCVWLPARSHGDGTGQWLVQTVIRADALPPTTTQTAAVDDRLLQP